MKCGITIPRLSSEVPHRLMMRRTGKQTGTLAQVLLGKGIIKPCDWTGDLSDTIQIALTRWVNVELGAEHLAGPVRLYYTDNVEEMFPDLYATHNWQWAYQGRHSLSRPDGRLNNMVLGGIGLMGSDMGELLIGAKVAALEKLSPGFGFAVLHTGICALEDACTVFSFKHAEHIAELHGDRGDKDGATDLTDLMKHIPTGAFFEWSQNWWQGLEDRLKNPRKRLPRWARELQELALETWQRCNCVAAIMNHLHGGWQHFESIPSCSIRWSSEDAMDALRDDYIELCMQESEWTHWQYIAAWDWNNAATLDKALEHLRLSLISCSSGWRLLNEMHGDPRLVSVFKKENS